MNVLPISACCHRALRSVRARACLRPGRCMRAEGTNNQQARFTFSSSPSIWLSTWQRRAAIVLDGEISRGRKECRHQ